MAPTHDTGLRDVGEVRTFLRTLVPAWLDRVDAERDASPEAWFLLGVCELLALRLPSDAGLVERDWRTSLEGTWVRFTKRESLDVREATYHAETSRKRRIACAAMVHDLERQSPNRMAAWLSSWSGRGYPSDAQSTLERVAADRRRTLSFEADWQLSLATWPPPGDDGSAYGDATSPVSLSIFFHSHANGYLKSCKCALARRGGIARIAQRVQDEKRADPELIVIDLGNFTSPDPRHPSHETDLYVSLMDEVPYDAVAVGRNELYAGIDPAAIPAPVVATGIRDAGEPLAADAVVLQRAGLRIGFVGFNELYDHGFSREPAESGMVDVRVPHSIRDIEPTLRRVRSEVDVLIVGGTMRPASVRELSATDLGVDLVLVGGTSHDDGLAHGAGFVGATAVALDGSGERGINRVTLSLDSSGKPCTVWVEDLPLGESEELSDAVVARIDAHEDR